MNYTVIKLQPHESLNIVAHQRYGDRKLWKAIADFNDFDIFAIRNVPIEIRLPEKSYAYTLLNNQKLSENSTFETVTNSEIEWII